MKRKSILTLLVAGLLTLPVFSFASCSFPFLGGEEGDGNTQTYTLEAEYTDLTGVLGAGISSGPSELELIHGDGTQAQKDLGWSEGYFIKDTYNTAFKLTFNLTADRAGTATLILRVGCEFAGGMTMDSSGFGVTVNGKEIAYSGVFIQGTTEYENMKFYDKTISTKVELKEGANVIELSTHENTYNGGNSIGGPLIDCIKLKTASVITWTPKTENVTGGGIG